MAYGNPRFSELGKVLTKVALEYSRMVLCSPDWGAHGGNEYWRTLLNRLTILPLSPGRTSTQLLSRLYNERAMDSPWVT